MDILTSITTAICLGKKAIELTNNLANQEVRQVVLEVTEQLLQVKSDFLELKAEVLELKEANATLKAEKKKLSAPPELVFKDGFYYRQTDLDAGIAKSFCAYCYESTGKANRLIATVGQENKLRGPRKCPGCNNYQ